MGVYGPEVEKARQAVIDRAADLASWRNSQPAPDGPGGDLAAGLELEARARALAAERPAFASALSLWNAGLTPVPLDPEGRPLGGVPATRDLAELVANFIRHPQASAGAACGPDHDLVALALGEQGWAWLGEQAIEPLPDGFEPDPDERDVRRWERAPGGVGVRLVGPHQPRRVGVTTLPLGARGRRMAEELRSPPAPPVRTWLAWRWPHPAPDGRGWDLGKAGRVVAVDGELLGAVPAGGSRLERDGLQWEVGEPVLWGRCEPMPGWLAQALGGKLRAAAA